MGILWDFDHYAEKSLAYSKALEIQKLCIEYKNCSRKSFFKLIEQYGYAVKWSRFNRRGGVGTIYWQERKKSYRVLVGSALQSNNSANNIFFVSKLSIINVRGKKSYGFKYGYCIDILVI